MAKAYDTLLTSRDAFCLPIRPYHLRARAAHGDDTQPAARAISWTQPPPGAARTAGKPSSYRRVYRLLCTHKKAPRLEGHGWWEGAAHDTGWSPRGSPALSVSSALLRSR